MFRKLCSCISCLVVLIPSLIIGVAFFVDKDSRVAVTDAARFLFKPQTYCKDNKTQLELGGWIIGKSQRINGQEVSVNILGKTAMIGDIHIADALRFHEGPCKQNVAFEGKVKAAFNGDYCDREGRQVFDVSKATRFFVATDNDPNTLGTILHKDVLFTVVPTGISDVADGMLINHPTLGKLDSCSPLEASAESV